ncbi:MAG: T9SS type A sorting domain-containing protein [Agriterribacter sp.]
MKRQRIHIQHRFSYVPVYSIRYVLFVCLSVGMITGKAQGDFCYSGLEAVNFGIIDLSVSSAQSWGTDRLSQPGYFSAVNGAAYSGSSDNFHINGYVKKYGNEPFIFPVGSGTDLRTVRISAPAAATDAYATAWIPGDPGTGLDLTAPYAGAHPVGLLSEPLVAVNSIGQWDWQVGNAGNLGEGTTGTGAGLTITVSMPDMSMFATAGDLRLAGWNGTSWIDLSGGATASGNTENSQLSGIMAAGITAIAIASISAPISSSFDLTGAVAGECSVQLQWKASGNAGIREFSVEQSANGVLYKEVAKLAASRFPVVNTYTAVIAQADFVNYYRLKIIYEDDVVRYSGSVAFQLNCQLNEKIVVYPNPVQNQQSVNVRIATAYRGTARVVLISAVGQRLQEIKIDITSAITVLPMNVWPLANGVYFIHVLKQDGSGLGKAQQLLKAIGR